MSSDIFESVALEFYGGFLVGEVKSSPLDVYLRAIPFI